MRTARSSCPSACHHHRQPLPRAQSQSSQSARRILARITRGSPGPPRESSTGRQPQAVARKVKILGRRDRACRAWTTTAFSFGDDDKELKDDAWVGFRGSSEGRTHPVGTRKPNPWGLHDMHGNMSEWCLDGYGEDLPGGTDPVQTDGAYRVPVRKEDPYRVCRGGSYYNAPSELSCAARRTYLEFGTGLGFRVVLTRAQP